VGISKQDQALIDKLAESIISSYNFDEPPVPIEKILSNPPEGLSSIDISDLSLVFGIGEHRYEYRMAMARLLYREVCRASRDWKQEYPYSNEAARYFAANILIPSKWVLRAARRPFISLEQLSEEFQVPGYAMSSRLAKLGKRVRGM
jgi:hypothetical protein